MDWETTKVGTVEPSSIPAETRRVSDGLDVSYFGSIETEVVKRLEKDISESNAGNLANQGIRLLDLYHQAGGDEAQYLQILEEEAGEEVEEAKERAFDALWNLTRFLAETAESGELDALASEIIDAKFVSEVSHGGAIEQHGVEVLADYWDADETLLQSTAIAAETGVRDPESAGIDAALKVEGQWRTVQVKTGDGGDVDCEADWLLRVNPETGNVAVKEI